MSKRSLLALALGTLVLPACSLDTTSPTVNCNAPRVTIPTVTGDTVELSSGVKFVQIKTGTGDAAVATDTVTIKYDGYLTNGTLFDTSANYSGPVKLDLADVIPGFSQGVVGLQPGGQRRIFIPPSLAYGATGSGACIPGNASLIFDVELVSIGG